MLDKKLKEIRFKSIFHRTSANELDSFYSLTDDDIAQIKQAFIEDGWGPLTADGKFRIIEYINQKKLYTGQEWYSRYKKLSDENADTLVPVKHDGGFDYKAFGEELAMKASKL